MFEARHDSDRSRHHRRQRCLRHRRPRATRVGERVERPWGEPSDDFCSARWTGVDMVFLPRHGRGHVHSPTSINYRANIDALKRAGVTDVISVSACGSLREDLPPGTLRDRRSVHRPHLAREKSFFGRVSWRMSPWRIRSMPAARRRALAGGTGGRHRCAKGGTYLAMEGPQFSTLAESNLYRSWGCSVIGMTAWRRPSRSGCTRGCAPTSC